MCKTVQQAPLLDNAAILANSEALRLFFGRISKVTDPNRFFLVLILTACLLFPVPDSVLSPKIAVLFTDSETAQNKC